MRFVNFRRLFLVVMLILSGSGQLQGVREVPLKTRIQAVRHFLRGSSFQKEGRLVEARQEYEKSLELDSELVEAHNNLGTVFYELSNFRQAEKNYQRAPSLQRDFGAAYSNLGTLYARQWNRARVPALYDRAEGYFLKAIEHAPDIAESYNGLGILYTRRGQFYQASEFFRKAQQVRTDYPDPYINMGYVMTRTGRLQGAVEELKKALLIDNKSPQARHNLGIALQLQDDWESSQQELEKTISDSPDFAPARIELAALHLRRGAPLLALEAALRAVEVAPESAAAHNILGVSRLRLEQLEEASREFRKALQLDEKFVPALSNLGFILSAQGKYTEALKMLNRATDLDPYLPDPYRLRGDIYFLQEKSQDAVTNYRKYLELMPEGKDVEKVQDRLLVLETSA